MTEDRIDLKMIFHLGIRYWYLFVGIIPLALAGAYYYLQITQPTYVASASVLVKDDKNSGQLSEEVFFQELGLGGTNKNLENERAILGSSPLLAEVVKNRELQYQYIKIGTFAQEELYYDSPIRVTDWQPAYEGGGLYGEVHLQGNGKYTLEITLEDEQKELKGEFGKALVTPMGKLTLIQESSYEDDDPIAVRISSIRGRAKELQWQLSVDLAAEKSSILNLTYKDVVPDRAKDVLDELIVEYNKQTTEVENQVFRNTIDLINERIGLITEELTEAERDVQAYKQRFSMVELSSEGTLLMNELSSYNKNISENEVQVAILESIEKFLIEHKEDFEYVPTNAGMTNLTLAGQLESFNRLVSEKARVANEFGPAHPDLKLVERQLRNLRQTIIDNIGSMKKDLLITKGASEDLKNNLEARLQSLPRRERELIEIERRKNIKENLFVYLLQKREESAISMAVIMPKAAVIEPPERPWNPESPKRIQIWLSAIFLGLFIPTGIIYLLNHLNDKIQGEEEIERATSVPVAGVLAHNSKDGFLVVKENSRSVSAEMFRMLRTNLSFFAPGNSLQTLLITSATSGEGKSFISLNLGMTMALAGKKVVILEGDLRKPDAKAKVGIVNYLVGSADSVPEIVRDNKMHPNLDIISCGPKPPNPGELILSDRMRELMRELREQYDFIIVDSAPVGIVADAFQMQEHVDATLFVVRAGYTPKGYLKIVDNIAEKEKLPRPIIVLNGVKLNRYYGYGYNAYGYGNGQGYVKSNGYFEKETK